MQRRAFRITVVLTAVLACSLVASTTLAFYRVSLGTQQCCKSHCRHTMPKHAAQQCCRSHETIPASTVPHVASPDVAALVVASVVPTGARPDVRIFAAVPHRGPPGGPLLAQHTSLAL